jgi:endonuclease/exonuclease/phosphatase family metal-dependent hydrolase
MRIRVATYNMHSAVGADRRFKPDRIMQVIRQLRADVIALQEVLSPVAGVDVHELLRAQTGFHFRAMATLQLAGGTFGNALLSRWPIASAIEHGLTVGAREPRGALDATLDRGGRAIRILATHLGLRGIERTLQIERLADLVRQEPDRPTVIAGDFNVPRARGRELSSHTEVFGRPPARATFPAIAPVLPLDRIFVRPHAALVDIEAHRSRAARAASDHLPLVATIELPD